MPLALSILMAALLGFAAHRAGLCTVKAVAEIVTTRRAHILTSFAKSALWVLAASALAGAVALQPGFRHWPLGALPVLGGVLFGLGAGLNGGCTFSTLSRLMDGNLGLFATVAGWPAGLGLGLWAMRLAERPGPLAAAAPAGSGPGLWLGMLLAPWMAWELWQLLLRARRAGSARRFFGAPVYALSAAAALLGLSNAVILISTGPWSFTGTLLCGLGATTLANCSQSLTPWLIAAAALAGMLVSALQRRSFRLRLPRRGAALRHGAAGVVMGLGAALVPGGNDGLVLFGMPSLSPHALPAYLGMLAGVLAALLVLRALGGTPAPILCHGDICRSQL